ncbi:hypothetical protein [Pseudoalteromonas sp. Q18-MNA-CIBAN-0097]|uniref:hypothetical protein n=1 Tax=Pseudoalteromonas sp. Q18-MNA-CIBAN-0097 TaxID=3140440 RepID=UPI00333074AE
MIDGKFEVLESLVDFDRRWSEVVKYSKIYETESLINNFMLEMLIFKKADGSYHNVSSFLTPYEVHSIAALDKAIIKTKLLAFIHKINDEELKLPKLHCGSMFYSVGAKKVLSRTAPTGNEP